MFARLTTLALALTLALPMTALADGVGGRKPKKGGKHKEGEQANKEGAGSSKAAKSNLERCEECEAGTYKERVNDSRQGNEELVLRKALRAAQLEFAKTHASELKQLKLMKDGATKTALADKLRKEWLEIRAKIVMAFKSYVERMGDEQLKLRDTKSVLDHFLAYAKTYDPKTNTGKFGRFEARRGEKREMRSGGGKLDGEEARKRAREGMRGFGGKRKGDKEKGEEDEEEEEK